MIIMIILKVYNYDIGERSLNRSRIHCYNNIVQCFVNLLNLLTNEYLTAIVLFAVNRKRFLSVLSMEKIFLL